MTQALAPTAPQIKVNGALLGALVLQQLDGVRISRALGLPGRATLRFADIGYTVAAGQQFAVGAKVEISTHVGDELFAGEVTGVDLRLDHGQPDLSVIVDDPSYRLALGTRIKTFTNVSYADIVATIASEYSLRASVHQLTDLQDYVLQTDSDYGFLSQIADRTGYEWHVADDTLQFQPAIGAASAVAQLTVGEDLDTFEVRASALHPSTPTIRGWWPKTKQSVVADGPTGTIGADSTLAQPFLAASELTSHGVVVSNADAPIDQQEAEVLAQRLVGRWRMGSVTARGTCPALPVIQPGVAVEVLNAGPASGTYQVSEVEHSYGPHGFRTRFVAGDRSPAGLVDVLGGAATGRSSFRYDGLVVGEVTKISGSGGGNGGDPGHIKVKYTTMGDTIESNWARVVSVGAGAGRGVTFMPEINDEVLVGFEGGDPRRPIVLGGLFNGNDQPPEFGVASNAVDRRRITSRLGHFVEFADGRQPTDQHISFTLQGGNHVVRLGADGLTAKVPAGKPVKVSAGDSFIEIAADGGITLSGTKITLKSSGPVDISGVNVTAKATSKVAISGTQTEVKAAAAGEVSAGGMMTVKGAMVAVN